MIETPVIDGMKALFPGLAVSEFRGQVRLVAPPDQVHDVLESLKERFGFDFLADVTCVDYLDRPDAPDRFGLVYVLANTKANWRLVVRTHVGGAEPTVPSAVDLWEGANWLEREVWDLFGVRFEGHPDLRRLVLPDAFESHPLRKDYPLRGRGERHNHPFIPRSQS
ncbi:MAG: NADH-quinone oxidoreductase subunit C [Pirellulales bacterium]|nr:NADH-quinone oxidoreductase subunit C [Pirellulales bacterium]